MMIPADVPAVMIPLPAIVTDDDDDVIAANAVLLL